MNFPRNIIITPKTYYTYIVKNNMIKHVALKCHINVTSRGNHQKTKFSFSCFSF